MNRRNFLKNLAITSAAARYLPKTADAAEKAARSADPVQARNLPPSIPDVSGHTQICEFAINSAKWKVFEDLRTRDGDITFIASDGQSRALPKSAEATFAEANPPYLGLSLKDIGMSPHDLLVEKLLENGDPNPELVKSAAPPMGSAM